MKIVFFSNFLNHHQLPLCLSLANNADVDFTFVANEPLNTKVVSKGYDDMNLLYDFCLPMYLNDENKILAKELADTADIVITGSFPFSFFKERIKANKIILRYSEHLFKPLEMTKNLKSKLYIWLNYTRYKNKNVYYLCASSFLSKELSEFSVPLSKFFKWGYFPKGSEKSINELIELKKENKVLNILWAGRLIGWKHLEVALETAKILKEKNIDFKLNIIGDGEEKDNLIVMAKTFNIIDVVEFKGAVHSSEVIKEMEKADIFLTTSDENEGWGAVLNESMSAGCVAIASKKAGSTAFLINHGVNGYAVDNNASEIVKYIEKPSEEMIINAVASIREEWNSENAADRLVGLCANLLQGIAPDFLYGPCS